MIKSQVLKKLKLPDAPGVYFFKYGRNILYIGKATSLKDRVKSYFRPDLIQTRGPLLVDMIYKANKIDFIKTNSVLEAIILEANLIKKYQPKYNTKEKDNKSFNYVVITDEDFPRIIIVRGREIERGLNYKIKERFGPFTSAESLRIILKIIRKIFPYRDRCLPLSEKPLVQRSFGVVGCFNRQLGLCPGVCDGSISKSDYAKIIRKIKLILSGKINNLKVGLKKEMEELAIKQEFEKANVIKKQIFSLEHISDVSLVKEENLPLNHPASQTRHPSLEKEGKAEFRIEAYDVAHLSGTNNVGVMVVMENGEFKKSDYRKFIIRNSKGNDISALEEVLERRSKHQEWPRPNLVVVDGGLAHLNIAKQTLDQGLTLIQRNFVVAVTKDEKHRAKAIIGNEEMVEKYKKEILLINNEAHRFAIAFHRKKRSAII